MCGNESHLLPPANEVHMGGGWLPSIHHSSHEKGEGVCIQGGVCIRGATPPPPTVTKKAGGTHPAGMLSCFLRANADGANKNTHQHFASICNDVIGNAMHIVTQSSVFSSVRRHVVN